jgi:hypothetical protein
MYEMMGALYVPCINTPASPTTPHRPLPPLLRTLIKAPPTTLVSKSWNREKKEKKKRRKRQNKYVL